MFAGQRENPACDNYRGKKNDLLTVVFEGNLKTRINGIPERLEMSGSARGPIWPEVDEVLGPGQWWPGRLGDEDPRMPMVPGPRWSGPLWVAFVQESLPGRASLERSG